MKVALLGLAISTTSLMSTAFSIESKRGIDLGYEPTINKKICKRMKRKAARRSGAPKAEAKPHNQRNKKGKP